MLTSSASSSRHLPSKRHRWGGSRPDCYLILTGPRLAALFWRASLRPWCIAAVYLFDAKRLLAEQCARVVKIDKASSVRTAQWGAAEI
jgi:hypothetical protein